MLVVRRTELGLRSAGMKLAIYGDSFGDIKKYEKFFSPSHGLEEHVSYSWPALLANKYKVDNFSKTTSGLEWSYNLAITNETTYDRIIFLASHINRLMINSTWSKEAGQEHINQGAYGNGNKFFTKKILPAAQQYNVYFQNDNFLHNRINLMYNDLQRRFGDKLLLLKIFEDGKSNEYNHSNNLLIVQHYGQCNMAEMLKHGDHRTCHITNPHHQMMFNKLDNWIQTKEFSLTQTDVITINKQELAKYFND
jgi:hypothetical protein